MGSVNLQHFFHGKRRRRCVSFFLFNFLCLFCEISSVLFRFDNEILVRRAQVVEIWEGFSSADVRLGSAEGPPFRLDRGYPVNDPPKEIARFFDRLPSDATYVEVESSIGPIWLILSGNSDDLPLLRGMGRVE